MLYGGTGANVWGQACTLALLPLKTTKLHA